MRIVLSAVLALALSASAPWAQTAPVAGQPIRFGADHPEAEFLKTTGYQLYVNEVRTGNEIAAATAWNAGLVTLTHPGLAAGTYRAHIEAVRRTSTGEARARSTALDFSVGPGTDPVPTTPPTLVTPTGLYIRWGDLPPPTDANEGGLVQRVLPFVSNGSAASATLHIGSVLAGQPVVIGISQPGSGGQQYTVEDNLGRKWTRAGLAKFGTSDFNTRGSQIWVAPALAKESSLSVTATIQTAGIAFHMSAVVLEYGEAEYTGQETVDPDNTLSHRCGPDPWPMENSGIVICLATMSGNATLTPMPGASLLPGGSSFFAWFANEREAEESGHISFTSNALRRAATVGVRVR